MPINGLSGVRSDRSYSYRKLEAHATVVRNALNIPAGATIDSLQLFEDLHEISIQRTGGGALPLRGGVVALEDSEGYTRFDRNRGVLEILASERTYQWLEQEHPRARYFVAHELGHCILHTDQLVRLAQLPTMQQAAFHRGRQGHKVFEDTEWQANAFASALLMPAEGLAGLESSGSGLTVFTISECFGVSHEAAGYRLELYRKRKPELLS